MWATERQKTVERSSGQAHWIVRSRKWASPGKRLVRQTKPPRSAVSSWTSAARARPV